MTQPANAGQAMAMALIDEWVRCGVTDACLSPGSRSAPLAMALAADHRLSLHVLVDERSSAFLALGIAKASGRPAIVVSTSGTAAANFHPAVVEACHSSTPLLVLTADRPPELRGTGANQTIDQLSLYGRSVRFFADAGVPESRPSSPRFWRSLACRAFQEACGSPPGAVHLNLPLREPLVPVEDEAGFPHPLGGRPDGKPWTETARPPRIAGPGEVGRLASLAEAARRPILVAGDGCSDAAAVVEFAHAVGWPVLADPLSGARQGPLAISCYEALLRHPSFAGSHRPDLVVRVGSVAASRTLGAFLDPSITQVLIDPDHGESDPERALSWTILADPARLLGDLAKALPAPADASWTASWTAAESAARTAVDACLDATEAPSEPRAARDLCRLLADGACLVAASSMPVRDIDWFMGPRSGLRLLGNRGASGIDGFVSTALGVSIAHPGPVAALCGDLSLLHDQNGLMLARSEDLSCAIVVVNNDGGAIFSFLPQAGFPEDFERLFGTPHGLDMSRLASTYGIGHTVVEKMGGFASEVKGALEAGGVRIVELRTDRRENVAEHRRLWEEAGAAIDRL